MRKRISLVDFYIPSAVKVPIVFFTRVVPFCFLILFAYILAHLTFPYYAKEVTLFGLLLITAYLAQMSIGLGSRKFIHYLWTRRHGLALLKIPHPILQNIPAPQRHLIRQTNYAMIVMENKLWAFANGILAVVFYGVTCVFLYLFFPTTMNSTGVFDTLSYCLVQISGGILLDFFGQFKISLYHADPNYAVRTLSFFMRVLVTYIVVKLFWDYYSYRRIYWHLLRDEALSMDAATGLM